MIATNTTYVVALATTLFVEFPVLWLGLRHALSRSGQSTWRLILVFLVTNLFTHGTLWSVWPQVGGRYFVKLIVAEVIVWLVESVIFWLLLRIDIRRVVWVTGLANLVSTLVGLVFWTMFT